MRSSWHYGCRGCKTKKPPKDIWYKYKRTCHSRKSTPRRIIWSPKRSYLAGFPLIYLCVYACVRVSVCVCGIKIRFDFVNQLIRLHWKAHEFQTSTCPSASHACWLRNITVVSIDKICINNLLITLISQFVTPKAYMYM